MKLFKTLVTLLLVSVCASAAAAEKYSALSREMKAVWSERSGMEVKRARIAVLFPKLTATFPGDLGAVGTDDLGSLMEALNGSWYFLEDESIVEKAEKVFGELARRRFATADHVFAMQTIYIGAHRFTDALRIRADYPEIDTWAVPSEIQGDAGISSGTYRYYRIEAEGKTLRLDRADLSENPAIILYGSPDCKFTMELFEKLPARPELRAALLAWGRFITTDDDFKELVSWNKQNPWKYVKVYSRKDWPAVKMAGAPEITVFSGGNPVCYVRGWHGAETISKFAGCLEASGLLSDLARMRAAVSGVMSEAARDLPLEETRGIIRAEYNALKAKGAFDDAALNSYAREDIPAVFEFMDFYASGSRSAESAALLRKIYARMENYGLGEAEKGGRVYDALLAGRDFEAARVFQSAYPDYKLAKVPAIRGNTLLKPGRKLVYVMDASPDEMSAEGIEESGLRVVMVSLPGCHFSSYALKAIEENPQMLRVFKKHGQVLTSRADFQRIFKRNSSKGLKYKLVSSAADWPALDFSSSPVFYFMKDGEVAYSFSGWPKKGRMDELFIGLGRIGLLSN